MLLCIFVAIDAAPTVVVAAAACNITAQLILYTIAQLFRRYSTFLKQLVHF